MMSYTFCAVHVDSLTPGAWRRLPTSSHLGPSSTPCQSVPKTPRATASSSRVIHNRTETATSVAARTNGPRHPTSSQRAAGRVNRTRPHSLTMLIPAYHDAKRTEAIALPILP
jgi:hypothetical protein